ALEAVLAEIGSVDALWVCGDTVGYGPDPSDVLALLRERGATLVAGNHDRAVATGEDLELFNRHAASAALLHQGWLSAEERDTLDLAEGTITFHRSSYQIDETQRRMRARGLPAILADRLAFGL